MFISFSIKFLVNCLNYDSEICNDKFPINPSTWIKVLYKQVEDHHNLNVLKHSNGKPKGLELKLVELCLAIAAENKFQASLDTGHGWPINIDF